jgi:hypothetical protein
LSRLTATAFSAGSAAAPGAMSAFTAVVYQSSD